MTEGMQLPNKENIRTHREIYKYLGILEAHTIKQVEMKEKIKRLPQENEKASWDKII